MTYARESRKLPYMVIINKEKPEEFYVEVRFGYCDTVVESFRDNLTIARKRQGRPYMEMKVEEQDWTEGSERNISRVLEELGDPRVKYVDNRRQSTPEEIKIGKIQEVLNDMVHRTLRFCEEIGEFGVVEITSEIIDFKTFIEIYGNSGKIPD